MQLEVIEDAGELARRGAELIAQQARESVRARGRFLLALSGGETPWPMLEWLAQEDMPWALTHVFQVDERLVGSTDSARNLSHLQSVLLSRVAIPEDQVHPMPVEDADPSAASHYAATLERVAGAPPILDVVQLGLGEDGHTASLVPGDPFLESFQGDVALTGPFHGYRRMTLGYQTLARARMTLWLVTGANKSGALSRLLQPDRSLAATRRPLERAVILADPAAAGDPWPSRSARIARLTGC